MPTTIAARPPDRTRRRRVLGLSGLTAVAVLVTSILAGDHPPSAPAPDLPPAPPPQAPPADDPPVGGWDVAAQTALASRPMPRLPESAAWPHPLHGGDTAAPIVLPMPTSRSGPVPSGFPGTVEGAIAQLAALTQVGVDGGDPHGYRHAYEAVAASGAPAVETTRLHRDLRRVRATVDGLPPTGPVPGLEFRWTPTSAATAPSVSAVATEKATGPEASRQNPAPPRIMVTVSCHRNSPTATAPPIHSRVGQTAKKGDAGDGLPAASASADPSRKPPTLSTSSNAVRNNHIAAAQTAFMI